jgi:hypothetical protein
VLRTGRQHRGSSIVGAGPPQTKTLGHGRHIMALQSDPAELRRRYEGWDTEELLSRIDGGGLEPDAEVIARQVLSTRGIEVTSASSRDVENDQVSRVPSGVGGWLILVVLGLIFSSLRTTYVLLTTYWPVFRDRKWQMLTTPESPAYHHLWGPLIAYETIGSLIGLVLALTTLVMLLRKSKNTPSFAIGWFAYAAVFGVVDYFFADLIPYVAQHPDPDGIKELARGLVAAAIWIPYFLVSKRVKATFVK